MRAFKFFVFTFLLLVTTLDLQAKWWIFGQDDDAVTIDYLYANTHNFDDFAETIVLYNGALKENQIHIRGKATASSGKVAKVVVTLDGKKSWQKAKLSKDGSFDFSFEPELDSDYDLYVKAVDTTTKSNDIEATHKKLKIIEGDIYAFIAKTLDALREAYMEENGLKFLSYVSDRFTSDIDTLGIAIRKDFTLLENINIEFTINSVAEAEGHYYASISYNRRVISTITGENFHDLGVTEFGFVLGDKGALLYSMKNPLIFGVSDPENVAQGDVASTENGNILIVNPDGTLTTGPLSGDVSGGPVTSGLVSLSSNIGFIFSDESTLSGPLGDYNYADMMQEHQDVLIIGRGHGAQDLGMIGLDTVTEAPVNGYLSGQSYDQLTNPKYDGHTIAIKLTDGNYALVEIQPGYTMNGGSVVKQYRYKYNPNHSPRF